MKVLNTNIFIQFNQQEVLFRATGKPTDFGVARVGKSHGISILPSPSELKALTKMCEKGFVVCESTLIVKDPCSMHYTVTMYFKDYKTISKVSLN